MDWKVAAVKLLCKRNNFWKGLESQGWSYWNWHVNRTTFQIGLRFKTGSSSLLVSCKCALTCVFECLFMFELAARILDKWEFSGVSEETIPILDSNKSTSNILNRCRINFVSSPKKWMRKSKKNKRCCKALCVNTQTEKLAKIFENIYILITFVQPEHFLS